MMTAIIRSLPRIALGLVLLVAGLLKGADPAEFARQITTYGLASGRLAEAGAHAMIVLEIGLGVALLVGFRGRVTAAAASLLMVVFMGVTAYAWSRGRTEGCGCFGSLASRTPGEVLLEDTLFLALGIAAFFMAPKQARERRWRQGAVLASAAGAVVLSLTAYALPLDPLVTDLRVGADAARLPLRESPVDLLSGDHLVALLDLDSPAAGAVVRRLNAYSVRPGAPQPIAFYGGEVDEKTVFCFNYDPVFEVVPVPRGDLKRLYRVLPRFFRIRDGKIVQIWEGLPPDPEELR